MAVTTAAGPDQDDDDKNLTILEHLRELRYRVMVSGGALMLAMVFSFWPITGWVLRWLKRPAEGKVENFNLVFTQPLEYWSTFFGVALMVGLAMAMPVIVYQILAFVGPGLTRTEKRWVYPIVLGASIMFVLGGLFAYYIELPPALNFLLDGQGVAVPFISVKAYVSFVTRMMMVTGIVFEMPLFVMGLAKIGVVRSNQLLKWWRYAIIGAFVVAAIVTPSIDPFTQILVALPMIVLYFFGIALARLVENNPIIPR
jgi:sec-independent protein translocase protein TatC